MPRAGFYTAESGKISFRRDGNWYSDDERIDNPRISLLFSRSIKRNPDGSYYLQVAEERAPITVEDTPYVVKALEDDELGVEAFAPQRLDVLPGDSGDVDRAVRDPELCRTFHELGTKPWQSTP